jgi:allophanate hydrolase subunit 1
MRKSPPALLAAGDQVTFEPLSLREYERMLTKAAASELCVTPEGPPTQGHRA